VELIIFAGFHKKQTNRGKATVIQARLKDCPEAAKAQDRHGNTLLHLGMKVWAPVEIINAFLEACLKR